MIKYLKKKNFEKVAPWYFLLDLQVYIKVNLIYEFLRVLLLTESLSKVEKTRTRAYHISGRFCFACIFALYHIKQELVIKSVISFKDSSN